MANVRFHHRRCEGPPSGPPTGFASLAAIPDLKACPEGDGV